MLWISLGLAIPVCGAFFVFLFGRWPNRREGINLTTAVSLFVVVTRLVPSVRAGEFPSLTLLEVLPGLNLAFSVEPLGLLFALVASGLWIVTSIYSIGYMRGDHEENQTRFYVYFALTIATAMGIAFSGNAFTLFIFYEMMTLATYPLVTHHGTREAVRAGRLYLGYLFGTSIALLFLALIWTWRLAGTLDFSLGGILVGKASERTVFLLLVLYAFGIGKAALMPFHRWLPAAMVAPTPVSALLHAVAVVKAGVFSILKVVVYIFGIELLQNSGLSVWLMYLAAATILIASGIALSQDNLKLRLAYSTVSQLAYVILGAALANTWGVIGAGMHIVMHAFGKITLFFCAGAILVATHKTKVSEMGNLGKTMPITMAAFLLGSLSIIGLPPFGGLWSKWYLIMGAAEAGQIIIIAVLLISSLLNIAYLMPVAIRAFLAGPPSSEGKAEIREAPWSCVIPLCVTSAGCLFLFFYADRLQVFLRQLVLP